MNISNFKGVERQVCRFLNMDRTPLSGGNGRITRADCRECGTPTGLYVEVKTGSRRWTWPAIIRLFEDTEIKARFEQKFPVLVIHLKGTKGVQNYPAYARLTDGMWAGTVVEIPLGVFRTLHEKARKNDKERLELLRAGDTILLRVDKTQTGTLAYQIPPTKESGDTLEVE